MRALTTEEKLVTVMVYTPDMLVRGDMIANQNARVSIWLRTAGVSNYVHLFNPQAILFGSGTPKPFSHAEMYVPTKKLIAFHIAPPALETLDYDTAEANRTMLPLCCNAGTFVINAKTRISSQTDLATSLDVMRTAWLSLYEADITNPYLPQFHIQVPMLLVSSESVTFSV